MRSHVVIIGCNLCTKLSSSAGKTGVYISGGAILVLWVALKLIEPNRRDWVVAVLYLQPQLICSHCGLSNRNLYFSTERWTIAEKSGIHITVLVIVKFTFYWFFSRD